MTDSQQVPEPGADTNTEQSAEPAANGAPVQLPDDHPLVTSLAAMKAQIKDLKADKSELDQIKASQQTETEKLSSRAEAAEQALTDLQGRYHGLLKAQAITKAAADHRAIDVDVITALIGDQVTVSDDGAVEGVDKAIRALAKAKPHLFNNTPAGSRDAGANGNHTPRSTPAQLFADTFQGRV